VLLFNWLSARLASYEAGLTHAKSELVDKLESGTDASLASRSAVGEAGIEDSKALPFSAALTANTVQREVLGES
jgi:hypothetical protein